MASNDQKESDLKAQIEKIADSIKEQGSLKLFNNFYKRLSSRRQPARGQWWRKSC